MTLCPAQASAMEEGLDPEEVMTGSLSGDSVKQKKRRAQCALKLAAKLAPLLVGENTNN